MKFVQKIEDETQDRYICGECGSTLVTCDKGEIPDIPDFCKHCGKDVCYQEAEEDSLNVEEDE